MQSYFQGLAGGEEMAKAIRVRPRSLRLTLLAVPSLVICHLSSGQAGPSQTEGRCAQARPSQRPSYESFFGRQSPVEAESPEWRIDLVMKEPYARCFYGTAFLFRVTNERSAAVSEFRLCSEALQVDEVDLISGSRAVILGRAGANFPVANILSFA